MADYIRRSADGELSELEQLIHDRYTEAASQAFEAERKFFHSFEALDAIKKKQVAAGDLSEEEWKAWRVRKITMDKRWKKQVNSLADVYAHADKEARDLIDRSMARVYSTAANFSAFEIAELNGIDFSLVNEKAVERLILKKPDTMPAYIPESTNRQVMLPNGRMVPLTTKDVIWGKQQISKAATSALLSGVNMDRVAEDVMKRIDTITRESAIRAARTSITSAENGGRQYSYERAEEMGIAMQKEWLATLDDRTRDSHRRLDHEVVKTDSKFSNGCRYPGDPQGRPAEVYNCRCTLIARLGGITLDKIAGNGKLNGVSYEDWKAGKKRRKDYAQIGG